MDKPIEISFEHGKYVVTNRNGHLETLRHGETWRNHCGDNLIHHLVERIIELETRTNPSIHWETTPVRRAYDGPEKHEG